MLKVLLVVERDFPSEVGLLASFLFFQFFKEELEDVSPLGVSSLEESIRRDGSQIHLKRIPNGSDIFLRVWESLFHLSGGHNIYHKHHCLGIFCYYPLRTWQYAISHIFVHRVYAHVLYSHL